MVPRNKGILTEHEFQAIQVLRELRRQVNEGALHEDLGRPTHLARHVIMLYHGHVQIRMSKIARELGVSVRSLERSFKIAFKTTMRDLSTRERLSFAQALIVNNPDLKMSSIGHHLGYEDPNVFERFFQKHAGSSPAAWSKAHALRSRADRPGSKDAKRS